MSAVKPGMTPEEQLSANFSRLRALLADMGMKSEAKDYNSQDVKFVREMIGHHEMAVEMADKEVDKGKNTEVIELAKAIRKAQKAEIAQMRKWLKDRDLTEEDGGGM